jgi:hypothetical protein
MQNELNLDLKDLTKLCVICPHQNCKAEICFDLAQELLAREVRCPVCQNVMLETRNQEHLAFTWASLIKLALKPDGKPQMYFRVRRDTADG